jgi:release factor glutamine methyltransferase
MSSVSESIAKAESILATNGIVEARREAASLVMLALKRDRTFLYAYPDHLLTDSETATLNSLVTRRAAREPLQYISGTQEFYGLDFEVTPDVLIPRPETEMVVEHAIPLLTTLSRQRLCEIGIGSGCIAVSMLHHLPEATAVGLDVSPAALKVARRNANRLGTGDRLQLFESDIFSNCPDERFEMIVSNPPYVPSSDIDGLQPEVRDFEPHLALTDGRDGLSIISTIVKQSPHFLKSGGFLLMEMGFNQSSLVVDMFEADLWEPPELFPDLQGIPRLVRSELI